MFSRSTEYAMRAIIYLAQKSSVDHKIGMAELAKAIDSPRSFTAKILQKLTKDNVLISSVTGPSGGFYLTVAAKKKSFLYVLEILGEDVLISGCILGLRDCSETSPCPMHEQYKRIRPQIQHMLSHKTIGELAGEMKDTRIVIHNVAKPVRKGKKGGG